MPSELVVTRSCPFAHRAWLTLLEVGAAHEVKTIDLNAPPAWFGPLYKTATGADPESDGKVPILVEDGFVLAESAVIAEFLANKYGGAAKGTALGPGALSAEQVARERIFAEQVVPQVIGGFFRLLRSHGDEAQAAAKAGLLEAYARVSAEYSREAGPFFAGERLSLADVLVWPITARLGVLATLRGFAVPETPEYAAFHAFVTAMRARPSVQATLFEDEWLAGLRHLAAPPTTAAE